MIINEFNIVCIASLPFKTNAPLIINTNAVLTLPVAFKRFQLIAQRLPEVLEITGTVQIDKLSSCLPFNSLKTMRPSRKVKTKPMQRSGVPPSRMSA